ncbi:MAG: choice-of-anchor J domain-containing protein [Chitinophagales bacterium]|nr:choice-of-anchor J domain-containing protein [Chitinophagales bacterium]MDW8392902.1 choice-of-anchor J domain-containing protein [Chitinophagales bacterium]
MKTIIPFLFAAILALSLTAQGQTTLLSQDFEGTGLPSGWSNISNATDGGWKFGTNTQLQSAYFPIPPHTKMAATNDDACNCDKGDEYLITPVMDFSGAANVFMSFDAYFYKASYNNKQEEAHVKISTDGGTTWTTVFTLPGNSAWTTYDVNLSAYAGQSNVKLAFNYKDGGDWLYGWALDNVKVYEPLVGTDLMVSTLLVGKEDPRPAFVGFQKYLTGLPLTVRATLTNKGTYAINSFDVSWTDGTSTHTETLTGLNVAPLATYTYQSQVPYVTLGGNQSITLSVSNVNGGANEISTTNNSKSYAVYGVTPNPDRKYLAEEATGTWCGWCPRGTVYMDYMTETYPDQFVGVAVHNGDPMANSTYDNGVNTFPGFMGYPSVIVDREYIIDPSALEFDLIDKISNDVPVKVTVSGEYNPSIKQLAVTVTGEFIQSLSGNYRFNAVIVEDSVTGTSSGYKQANYYAGGGQGLMGGFENLPSSIPANQMHYNHVGRAILGGFHGTAGSLPTTLNAGDKHSYTYTYVVPSTVNINRVHVVGMITQYNSNSDNIVINCNKGGWELASGFQEPGAPVASLAVYPNPATDESVLHYRLSAPAQVSYEIRNAIGQLVQSENLGLRSGEQQTMVDISKLSDGVYFVTLRVGQNSFTEKLVVKGS